MNKTFHKDKQEVERDKGQQLGEANIWFGVIDVEYIWPSQLDLLYE